VQETAHDEADEKNPEVDFKDRVMRKISKIRNL